MSIHFPDAKVYAIVQEEFARCMGIDLGDVPPITPCPHPQKADFSMNVARYAKIQKLDPKQFGIDASERINTFPEKKFILSAFAEGNYVNFKVDRKIVFQLTYDAVLHMGARYGSSTLLEPKRAIVEHTSANPNAALHIGNLRSGIIGAHLARLLKWVGYEVKELFFVNDLGFQIGLTAVGYSRLTTLPDGYKIDNLIGLIYSIMNTFNAAQKLNIKISQLRDHFPSYVPPKDREEEQDSAEADKSKSPEEDVIDTACRLHHFHPQLYDQLNSCFSDDEDLFAIASRLNQDYEAKVPEAVLIFRKMANSTLTGIQQTLDVYNVLHHRFDFESEISWDGTCASLLHTMQQSAFFCPPTDSNEEGREEGAYLNIDSYLKAIGAKEGKGGYQKPYPHFYLIRPDGTTLYTFRDVAYSMQKIGEADMVLNIICTEQNLPQEKVALALQILGIEGRAQLHVPYELVKLMKDGKIIKMSSRRGITYLADDLYDDIKTATKIVMGDRRKQKVDLTNESTVEKITHTVASASIIYALLGVTMRSPIDIDIKKAVDPTGNSAAFILYTGARISSIIQKFDQRVKSGEYPPEPEKPDWSLIADDPIVWELLTKNVMMFATECRRAAIPDIPPAPKLPEFGTHVIPAFAYQLAKLFSKFYGTRPKILNPEDPLMYPRISLCRILLQTLNNAMRLYMVEPLESM